MVAALILLGLGVLIFLIGYIIFLVDAFQTSVAWGLCVFFVPFAAIVFLFAKWAQAKRGFLLQMCGVPFMTAALLLAPKSQATDGSAASPNSPFQLAALISKSVANRPGSGDPAPGFAESAPAEATPAALPAEMHQAKWDALDRRFMVLETTYTKLTARRTTLDVGKQEAVRAFNAEVAAYRTELAQAQTEKAELLKQGPRPN